MMEDSYLSTSTRNRRGHCCLVVIQPRDEFDGGLIVSGWIQESQGLGLDMRLIGDSV